MDFLWQFVRIATRVIAISVAALFSALLIHLAIVIGVLDGPFHNPYEAEDICFVRDTPGATSRYVEYTFVTCSAPSVSLGPPIGADQATLRFKDMDHDGLPEAVIESSRYKCKFGQLGCYGAYRIVVRICSTCAKQVSVLSEESLPELDQS